MDQLDLKSVYLSSKHGQITLQNKISVLRYFNLSSFCKTNLKAPTNRVDLLFTELILHLSQVKEMCCQIIHLTHELISFIQIRNQKRKGRLLTKISLWNVIVGIRFWNCEAQIFLDLQPYLPYRIWPFSWFHMLRLFQGVSTLGSNF